MGGILKEKFDWTHFSNLVITLKVCVLNLPSPMTKIKVSIAYMSQDWPHDKFASPSSKINWRRNGIQ